MGLAASKLDLKEIEKSPLVPHKALYEIDLVATKSGSQIANIDGKMYYEWKPSCDAWITDHRFSLLYEYADSPAMQIASDFSTFETFDGKQFNFSARRSRDHNLYQELRGIAELGEKGGNVDYTLPENLKFDLSNGAMFPMSHTLEMVKNFNSDKKFFSAVVFDGSDDEGPVEINSFIGKSVNALSRVKGNEKINMALLNTPAKNIRMAVFPTLSDSEVADYEMDMVFHQNGIISDMLIEYGDFSVSQKLVALEKLEANDCKSDSSLIKREKN